MRVTHFLICTIAAGGAAILASGYLAYSQMQALSTARETRGLIATSESISRVIERATIERGAMTQLIVSDDPEGKIAAEVAKAVQETDARVKEMQDGVAATPFGKRSDLAGPANQIGQRLAQARQLARTEGAKPLAQRDPRAAQTFSATVLDLLSQQSALQRQIGASIGERDPAISNTISVGELATSMREIAGGRSVLFSTYIGNGVKLSPTALSQVDRFSGRIEQLWQLVDQALAQMEPTPRLKSALQAVKTGFRD
jgi:methyl-accepting chemotaxis protein